MGKAKYELRFLNYRLHVKDCVQKVQTEMATGNIRSEESLLKKIDRASMFLDPIQAFILFQTAAPYDWSKYLTPELMEVHDYNLGLVVITVANMVVSNDVYSEISRTDGYRFLTEGRHTKRIRWKIDDNTGIHRFTLREIWKAHASLFDHLSPFQIRNYKGKSLAVYRRDEGDGDISYTILLEHNDPTLIWKSKSHYVEQKPPANSIEYYEEQKCEILLHYGCPADQLWLTEVQTVDQFNEFYSTQDESADEMYGLQDYDYVLYHHESGEVLTHAGFNSDDGFDLACRAVAEYLKE